MLSPGMRKGNSRGSVVFVLLGLGAIALVRLSKEFNESSGSWLFSSHNSHAVLRMAKPPRLRMPFVPLDKFCYTDPGVYVEIHDGRKRTRRRSCFGDCKNAETVELRETAIEAPRVSSLCILNPFHGFYDCIWPLVHHLIACRRDLPPIIVKTSSISEQRQKSWVVRAQQMFLQNSMLTNEVIDSVQLAEGKCLCFKNVTKFRKQKLWRPLHYEYLHMFRNTTVTSQHPTFLKETGIKHFQETILRSRIGNFEPLTENSPILVYSRRDAGRREWKNVEHFIEALRRNLLDSVPIHLIHKVPATFEEQVRIHSEARALIAPHGAAMVNTLFMRENSVVVEIASRNCLLHEEDVPSFDMEPMMNVSDPNTWVPWHAQGLSLYHFSAPCVYLPEVNSNFITDNDSLVRITMMALSISTHQNTKQNSLE